ncbi:MAG TPA: acyloxyacyl hydrolase [Acidobacteriaceae bacterium]|nr:acyloxyacyl hydrolase [Acidobacteriaceae bacterium]
MALFAALLLGLAPVSLSQTRSSSIASDAGHASLTSEVSGRDFVSPLMKRDPWDRGVFIDGGFGTSGETSDHFLSAGVRIGKVLTDAAGPGILRGQFEYAVELIPYWQAFTPKETYHLITVVPPRQVTTGGTYTGLSMTPAILRWNLVRWKRVMPWLQGGGGLIWTNHKFPPNGPHGTSVWNFEPQIGIGMHYFVRPGQAITFAANAVHISNASLGDSNPGVNATVQLQIGYTWWK